MLDLGSVTELSDRAFAALAQRIQQTTGIQVGPAKRQLVQARLGRRLRALSLQSFDEYLSCLELEPDELGELVSAITTNHTHFFREPHHFQSLAAALREGTGVQRVWSAACSTGEEPYSIAIAAAEAGASTRILATDIDEAVLSEARAGIYDLERLTPVSLLRRKQFFERGEGARSGLARVKKSLRAAVEFEQMNLIAPWASMPPLDAIFCRNVLIYFDAATQTRLLRQFVQALRVGGLLFIGHSESLREPDARLVIAGRTTYRRIA